MEDDGDEAGVGENGDKASVGENGDKTGVRENRDDAGGPDIGKSHLYAAISAVWAEILPATHRNARSAQNAMPRRPSIANHPRLTQRRYCQTDWNRQTLKQLWLDESRRGRWVSLVRGIVARWLAMVRPEQMRNLHVEPSPLPNDPIPSR